MTRQTTRDHSTAFFLLALLLAVHLPCAPCRAGDEADVVRLEEVRVTASPLVEGNRVNEFGSQVTSVTDEQIEKLNAQDLPSALRRVPGVVISRHNPVGSFGGGDGGTIFIRGHGSSRPGAEISMLVDGIPRFVSIWTHPLMDVLSVDVIDKMVVYKSAQPVLFGNMAFGAVDMRTKRRKKEGFFTRVSASGGSYRTFAGVVEHGGKIEDFDYYFVNSYRRSDGHRDDADGMLETTFGRVGTRFSDNWGLDVTFTHTRNRADDPGSKDPDTLSQGRFTTRDTVTVVSLKNEYEFGEGALRFYLDRGENDWTDQDETPGLDTLTDYENYGIRAREEIYPFEGSTLIAGIDLDFVSGAVKFRDPEAGDSFFPEETWRMLAPYLLARQRLEVTDGLYVIPSAGVRYIDHSEFDGEWGPQAGLVVEREGTEAHCSWARGINYPGLYVKVQNDLFLPGENGWQDLEAETLCHFEAGVAHDFDPDLRADLTWFHDRGKDRVVVSPPPPFPPLLTNIGHYVIEGLEGTVTWSAAPNLSLFAGATWMSADPSDLPYTPSWSASAGAGWRPLEDLEINLDASWLGDHTVLSRSRVEAATNLREVDGFFLLSGKATWTLTRGDGGPRSEVYVAVENITNTDYEMKPGYPMPGTNLMAGLSLEF